MLKFAANLNFMFVKETSNLAERYMLAKQAGFHWVECATPYDVPISDIAEAREAAGVKQILINTPMGDLKAGDCGLAALPQKVKEFKDSLEVAIEYANALDCKKIHIMSGCIDDPSSFDNMVDIYSSNLKYAANRLDKEGIVALIEPISAVTKENYFMNSAERAFQYINNISHPNLKLQLDVFHLQMLEGNLTRNIEKFWPVVDHIQIAQAPHRSEPMVSGEINYQYIFKLFEKLNYSGFIGLEHRCTGETTQQALGWIKEGGYEM